MQSNKLCCLNSKPTGIERQVYRYIILACRYLYAWLLSACLLTNHWLLSICCWCMICALDKVWLCLAF